MKFGVLSDTHGFLDPRIFELFTGVSHILHAGDIGPDSIIIELETIAPVTGGDRQHRQLVHLPAYRSRHAGRAQISRSSHRGAIRAEGRASTSRRTRATGRGGVWPHAQGVLRNGQRRAVFQSRIRRQTQIRPGTHGGHPALRQKGTPAGVSDALNFNHGWVNRFGASPSGGPRTALARI